MWSTARVAGKRDGTPYSNSPLTECPVAGQNALRPMKPRTTVNRMILMSNQKLQFCM